MKPQLRQAFHVEMATAIDLFAKGELIRAYRHLEVAHVLGQRYVAPHVATHYWMLRIGIKHRSLPETRGEVIRMVLGALGSTVGIVPTGNTGGTNISMFKRLPVAPHIRDLVE